MADLTGCGLDTENGGKMGGFEPLPAGEYICVVSDSKKKATKANDGHYVEFTFQVVEGPRKGRLIFVRLNLWNKNPKAVEISKTEAEAIFKAIGVTNPRSTEEAHGKVLAITVRIKNGLNGQPENAVTQYRSRAAATQESASGYTVDNSSGSKALNNEDIPF